MNVDYNNAGWGPGEPYLEFDSVQASSGPGEAGPVHRNLAGHDEEAAPEKTS